MPGTLRSSVYLPAPVVFSAASTIAVGLPMMEKAVAGRWSLVVVIALLSACHCGAFRCNRISYRLIHLVVAGATTQIAAQRGSNVCFGRIGILRHQRFHRHDEAWSTVSALRTAPVAIRLLNCSQCAVFADTFNRCED